MKIKLYKINYQIKLNVNLFKLEMNKSHNSIYSYAIIETIIILAVSFI